MSVARNNLIRQVAPKSLFESALPVLSAASGCTWNQGDILCMDSNVGYLRPVTGTGDSSIMVGCARSSVTNGVQPSPVQGTPVDGSQAIEDMAGPVYGTVHQLLLATGTYKPGAPVYLTADPQTVTAASGGVSVGIYQGKQVTLGATGTYGDVLVGARFGYTDIHF